MHKNPDSCWSSPSQRLRKIRPTVKYFFLLFGNIMYANNAAATAVPFCLYRITREDVKIRSLFRLCTSCDNKLRFLRLSVVRRRRHVVYYYVRTTRKTASGPTASINSFEPRGCLRRKVRRVHIIIYPSIGLYTL